MKKILVTAATIAAIVGATATPAFANVLFSSTGPGQPVAVGSNSGSVQGQTHRSATGSYNKETNDGWMNSW